VRKTHFSHQFTAGAKFAASTTAAEGVLKQRLKKDKKLDKVTVLQEIKSELEAEILEEIFANKERGDEEQVADSLLREANNLQSDDDLASFHESYIANLKSHTKHFYTVLQNNVIDGEKRRKKKLPDLTVEEMRSAPCLFKSRNEPCCVLQVAEALAGLKNVSLWKLSAVTLSNARRLFLSGA
jgi:hypothetical protein